MKKSLFALSVCLLMNPLVSGNAFATDDTANASTDNGTATVAKHKKKHHTHKGRVRSLPTPAPAVDTSSTDAKPEEKPDPSLAWMDGLSGTFDLTSNYVFRGISQSEDLPAVQGGLTYTFPVGLYFNTWASNVKFPTGNASIEIDTIAGIRNSIGDNFSYDINIDRYNYPGSFNTSYNELNGVFSYKIFILTLGYSGDVYSTHKTGIYYNGGISYDIPCRYILNIEDVNFKAAIGHYSLPRAAGNSYDDYSATLSKKLKSYTLSAQWTATNGRSHNPPYDGNQILGTVEYDW